MDASLMVLIPISVMIVALVLLVLWWAARSGQFDDLEGPAHAILMDDDDPVARAQPGVPTTRTPAADSQTSAQ